MFWMSAVMSMFFSAKEISITWLLLLSDLNFGNWLLRMRSFAGDGGRLKSLSFFKGIFISLRDCARYEAEDFSFAACRKVSLT